MQWGKKKASIGNSLCLWENPFSMRKGSTGKARNNTARAGKYAASAHWRASPTGVVARCAL